MVEVWERKEDWKGEVSSDPLSVAEGKQSVRLGIIPERHCTVEEGTSMMIY